MSELAALNRAIRNGRWKPRRAMCAICGALLPKLRRRYCSEDCFRQGRRDYQASHQRLPDQADRYEAWRAANPRREYKHAHYLKHKRRYLAAMKRRYLRVHGADLHMANLGGGGQTEQCPTKSDEDNMKLEIYAKRDGSIKAEVIGVRAEVASAGSRAATMITTAGKYIGAILQIKSVTVSEKK